MLRVVPDVNVLTSAFISPNGVCRKIVEAADREEIRFVASPALIAEADIVLHRKHFRKYFTFEQADQVIVDLRRTSEMHYPDDDFVPITRDVKDDYLVHLAWAAKPDYLITGDHDLHGIDGVTVISPGDFVRTVLR